MDFQVFYTEATLAELQEVMRRSWQNHPETSERFANALLDHVDLLKDFPYLGAPVHGCPGVRRIQHSPLHVYYQVVLEPRRAEILHFWHSSRRVPGFLAAISQACATFGEVPDLAISVL